jgi:hypothetical protein
VGDGGAAALVAVATPTAAMRARSIDRGVCPQAWRRVMTSARCSVAGGAARWGHVRTLQQRAGAVLSHMSAAALWGFIGWDHRHPGMTVVGRWSRRHPSLRIHRTTRLDLDDRTRAIPVTTPARTLLDLAATLDHRPLRAATRRAQSLHRVNVRQLADARARHERRRGAARLAEIIATGAAPTKSELEDVVLDLILRGGHVHPDVNVPYVVARRKTIPDPPLARAAPRPRGRRRRGARQPARARGRRRAPGAARGSRRAGAARHLGAGDHPSGRHARQAAGGGCALH